MVTKESYTSSRAALDLSTEVPPGFAPLSERTWALLNVHAYGGCMRNCPASGGQSYVEIPSGSSCDDAKVHRSRSTSPGTWIGHYHGIRPCRPDITGAECNLYLCGALQRTVVEGPVVRHGRGSHKVRPIDR